MTSFRSLLLGAAAVGFAVAAADAATPPAKPDAAVTKPAAKAASGGAGVDKLAAAIQDGDHAALKSLLARHISPNTPLPDGSSVLMAAIAADDVASVKLLLAAGAKTTQATPDGSTAMFIACNVGDGDIVNAMLDAHPDVRVAGHEGVTPLQLCAGHAPSAVVQRMIGAGAPVDGASSVGQTPLMYAAANGRADNVETLLKAGAQINAKSNKGFTALIFAVRSGSVDTVKALLAGKADIDALTPDNVGALQLALFQDKSDIAALLVQSGAALNGWDKNGRQPLDVAVMNGDADLVKLMLAKGADPNGLSHLEYRSDPNDPALRNVLAAAKTPEERAALEAKYLPNYQAIGYTPPVVLLGVEGVAPTPPAPAPATPLLFAARKGSDAMMKLLVDAGSHPDFTAADGNNVLLAAAGSGKLAAVQYAISIHPDLRSARVDGSSVMHLAVAAAKDDEGLSVVRLLADKGAPIDTKNARGFTPGDLADHGTPKLKALFSQIVAERTPKPPAAASAKTAATQSPSGSKPEKG